MKVIEISSVKRYGRNRAASRTTWFWLKKGRSFSNIDQWSERDGGPDLSSYLSSHRSHICAHKKLFLKREQDTKKMQDSIEELFDPRNVLALMASERT